MIRFEKIKKQYGGRLLFQNQSFILGTGEKCGILGRNGTGKSTLFRLIVGEEELDEGSVHLPKHYRIGYLQQHIKFTKPTLLEEAALGLKEEERDFLYKAETILFGLGFSEEDLDKDPRLFSGGYQLRLHLAKVLLSEPDCLLLDEPTNYLDIVSLRWLTKFLKEWRHECLIISHEREFLDAVCTHMALLHRQTVRKMKGKTQDLFEQVMQEEIIHEKTRQKLDAKRGQLQNFVDRFGAKASKATQAQSKMKALHRLPVLEQLAQMDDLDFLFRYQSFLGDKFVQANEISFQYQEPLIDSFSLDLKRQMRIAIIGKNGRGKSTLLKLIGGILDPQQGSVFHAQNASIGYFGQTHIQQLHPEHTIEQEISLADPKLSFTEVRSICGKMLFSGDDARKKIGILSGGEKSRVLLGKILATPCNLLLLDEPTHHLDMESIEALTTALDEFQGAVILVTHSEMMLQAITWDKLIICKESEQVIFDGDYELFLENEGWDDEQNSFTKKKKEPVKKSDNTQDRAKALKPINDKISRLENEIVKEEELLAKTNAALLKASETNNSTEITSNSKLITEIEKKIETLFKQLEEASLEKSKLP